MLYLKLAVGDKVMVGDIEVTIVETRPNKVKLGFDGADDTPVVVVGKPAKNSDD